MSNKSVSVSADDLERAVQEAQELVCAMFNRIRSETAFDRYSGIADSLHERLLGMLRAGTDADSEKKKRE